MKPVLACILVIFFLLSSCRHKNNSDSTITSRTSAGNSDTSVIVKLLQRIEIEDYPDPDSARKIIKTIKDCSALTGYEEGIAKAIFFEGNLFYRENKYKEALDCYSKALDLSSKLNHILLKAKCLERMGSVHTATDDPDLALKLYYESLTLFEKIKDTSGIAKVYNILGVSNVCEDRFDTGQYYLQKALELNTVLKDTYNIIENQGNLGYLFERSGDLDKAEKMYLELADLLKKRNDRTNLPVIYFDLGSLYQKKKKIQLSLNNMSMAIIVAEENHDTSLLSTIYGNTGEIYYREGKLDSAYQYLQKSYNFSGRTGDAETQIMALSFLISIDSLRGNSKDIIKKLQTTIILKDTVNARKIKNNIQISELNYENQKKQNIIETQELSLKLHKKERWVYILLLLITASIVVILTILLIYRRRNYLRIQKIREQALQISKLELERIQKNEEMTRLKLENMNESIRIKEQELLNIALRIDQKNELLHFIRKRIGEFPKETSEVRQLVQEIDKDISYKINESKDHDLFNERFSSLHKDFFITLKTKHPELTKSELKFCAYLSLNLSSAQIAVILNISPDGVKKNRYRIRKKLSLSPEASLEDYVSGI